MGRKSLANTVGSMARSALLALTCALMLLPVPTLAALSVFPAVPASDEREESEEGKEASAADPRGNRSAAPGSARRARDYLPALVNCDSARFGHPDLSGPLPPALTDSLRNGLGAPLRC
jgi:hypothetical protein